MWLAFVLVGAGAQADERADFLAGLTRDCPRCDLAGVNFKRRDLSGVNLSGADLTRAVLAGTNLRRANMYETKLDGAVLRNTAMPDGTISGQ